MSCARRAFVALVESDQGQRQRAYFKSAQVCENHFGDQSAINRFYIGIDHDQSRINAHDNSTWGFLPLPYTYNVASKGLRFRRSREDAMAAFERAKIVHFAGEPKPWSRYARTKPHKSAWLAKYQLVCASDLRVFGGHPGTK